MTPPNAAVSLLKAACCTTAAQESVREAGKRKPWQFPEKNSSFPIAIGLFVSTITCDTMLYILYALESFTAVFSVCFQRICYSSAEKQKILFPQEKIKVVFITIIF